MPTNVIIYAGRAPVVWGDAAVPPPPPPPPPAITAAAGASSGTVGGSIAGPLISALDGNASSAAWALTSIPAGMTATPSSGTLIPGASITPTLSAISAAIYAITVSNNSGGTVNGQAGSASAGNVQWYAPTPPPPAGATAFVLSGPSAGTNAVASTFTVTPNGAVTAGGTVNITATGATLSTASLTFAAGSSAAQTFTVTRSASGTTSVSITNTAGLTNSGSPISFTSSAANNSTPFLNARTGLRYATLQQAIDAATCLTGDTIKVASGTYVISAFGDNDIGMTRTTGGINQNTLTVEWETPGVMPIIDMSAFAFRAGTQGGQAVGIEAGSNNRSLTVRGLHLIGYPVGNSYGINTNQGYVPGVGFSSPPSPASTLTIEYCKIERWSDGVKGTIYNLNLTLNLRYSHILNCSEGSLTHGIYWPTSQAVNVLGSLLETTVAGLLPPSNNAGHLLKTRSRNTTVEGSLFKPAGGCAACIETPNGGNLSVKGNVIHHYGQAMGGDDNAPIKYGAEERARQITVNLTGSIAVGNTITGATSGFVGTAIYVFDAGTRIVYTMPNSGNFSVGEAILVSGVSQGTVLTSTGSIDGPGMDGRTHSVAVSQNTIRKDQPGDWSGSAAGAKGMIEVSASMTTENGTALPPASIATTVRNNIVADAGTAARLFLNSAAGNYHPDNSGVARSSINDDGVYSGAAIPGNPVVAEAAYAYAGVFQIPTARTDTYRGGRIAGLPAWRTGMLANTWKAIGTSSIADVDPANSALYNPNGAGTAAPWKGTTGQRSVVQAWGSAVWDEAGLKLWIPIGGGHDNYAGNEPYRQDLSAAVPTWVLPRPPSGAVGNTIQLNDAQEASGVYSDGRPRSPHTYNNVAHAPGVGPCVVRLGAIYIDPNRGESHKVFKLDQTTGESTVVYNFAGTGAGGATNGAACYDSFRNRIYSIGTNSSCHLLYCVPSNTPGMWSGGSAGPCYASEGAQGMVYIPTIDRILHISPYLGTLYHKLLNPVTGTITDLGPISGALASGFTFGVMPGFDWCPELSKVLLWNNGSNTAQVSTLTYPGNLTTAWSASTITVNAANAVTPPNNALLNGVFGMWRYSAALRGLMLITHFDGPTHFYATENIG